MKQLFKSTSEVPNETTLPKSVAFKSYLRNLTKQIRNAMSCDWTKYSAPCLADARHKNSESIAHPFIY